MPFDSNRAALHPPKPDIIFSRVCPFVSMGALEIFIFAETPSSSKPFEGNVFPSSMQQREMIVSSIPAAPMVCPRKPFKANVGTSDRLFLCNAIASIWSLYNVAVP